MPQEMDSISKFLYKGNFAPEKFQGSAQKAQKPPTSRHTDIFQKILDSNTSILYNYAMASSEANIGDSAIGCLIDIIILISLAAVLSENMMVSAIIWALILALPVSVVRLILYKTDSLDPWTARFLGPCFVVAAATLSFVLPLELDIFENGEDAPAAKEEPANANVRERPKQASRRLEYEYVHKRPQPRRSEYAGARRHAGGGVPRVQQEDRLPMHVYSPEELVEMFKLHARMARYEIDVEAEVALRSIMAKNAGRKDVERWVRAMFDRAIRRQNMRVSEMFNPTKGDLYTITAQDLD